MQNLSASIDDSSESIYSDNRKPEKVLIVVLTSNRGLCGAFNANVIKSAVVTLHTDYPEQLAQGKVSLITVGRKATEYLQEAEIQRDRFMG